MPGPFPYRLGYGPTPAPACDVTLSWNGTSESIPAIIDSGASRTTIPQTIAVRLGLRKVREHVVTGATESQGKPYSYYVVNIALLGFNFENHTVVALPSSRVLIGREILNRYLTLLDGRNSQFSID